MSGIRYWRKSKGQNGKGRPAMPTSLFFLFLFAIFLYQREIIIISEA